jgi:predicted nucleotidyltransferase
MKTSLDHLPAAKQRELEHIKTVFMREFEAAIASGTQPWRRNGKILKLILFGSFSRTDWVDEPQSGYQSDWDLLIVVSHEKLTDIADYWYVAEDKLLRDPEVGRTVNIIVHTLQEVNAALAAGQYFFGDIARDGIILYELPNHALATPVPPTAKDAFEVATAYFNRTFSSIGEWIDLAAHAMSRGRSGEWPNKAAFNLHQAAETAYACFLLVRTQHFPRSHNLKFLRSLAEDKEPRLIDSWPRATKLDRRRFELAKRAYVEARYSTNYEIGTDDLVAITAATHKLRDTVESVSREWLEDLRQKAGL